MRNFKVYKVRFKVPVCISVSPGHSLDDGACHDTVWQALMRLFNGALPGPQAAYLWVLVHCVSSKVSRVIIE